MLDETMDAARGALQGAHFHTYDVNVLPQLGVRRGARSLCSSELSQHMHILVFLTNCMTNVEPKVSIVKYSNVPHISVGTSPFANICNKTASAPFASGCPHLPTWERNLNSHAFHYVEAKKKLAKYI